MPKGDNAGAPAKEIDKEQFRKLVAMGCTIDEIAAWFNVSTKTIHRRKTEDPEYEDIFKNAKLRMHASLRGWQLRAAEKGNAAMLIWLGKIHLKQKDSIDMTVRKPIEEWTEEELKNAIRDAGGNPDEIIAGASAPELGAGAITTH